MKISVLTLFPSLFDSFLSTSILDRAKEHGFAEYQIIDIRKTGGIGKHRSVDDRPYGGGPGMILRADVLAQALRSVPGYETGAKSAEQLVVLMSAGGQKYDQQTAWDFSLLKHLIVICGHYEGIDQRFIDKYIDKEISIGDYVLTGGEIPALVIIDSVVRLIPGVLKKEDAVAKESFSDYLLEYPQYTRPDIFEGEAVPDVLKTGNHQKIAQWQLEQAKEKTKKLRPDLYSTFQQKNGQK